MLEMINLVFPISWKVLPGVDLIATLEWLEHNVLLYIILSITVSFFEDAILFLQCLFFHVYVHFLLFFRKYTCMCVIYLTSFDGFF